MLMSSYLVENGTIITPFLLFYLDLGLVCKKTYRFVQYTPMKCFNNFVYSAVNARKVGDENLNSSAVAETLKLLANSSYGYQIVDRSRHVATKLLSDEKTHGAINNKIFKCLGYIIDQLHEVGQVRNWTQREPNSVGIFALQYAELRMLELYHTFFGKFCDFTKFEELEMDADALDLALSEKDLYDFIQPAMKQGWNPAKKRLCRWVSSQPNNNFLPSYLLL